MVLLFLTLTVLFALIAWTALPRAVLLVATLLPAYLLRANFFGIPTTLLELMLFVVVAVWLIQNRRRLPALFTLEKKWAIAVALLVLSATVSAIIAPDTFAALGIWKAYFIEPILFFYVLIDLLRQEQMTTDRLWSGLLAGGALVAVVALIQWISGAGIPIPWDIERRVTGVFDYPNALGLYLGPLAVVAFARKRRMRICFGFLFILVLILAKSEAALGALFVTLVVMGLTHLRFRKWTIGVLIIFTIVNLTFPILRSYLLEKATLGDISGQVRLSQWSETWELLKDRPVFGAGLSGYPTALAPYHKDTHIEIFQYPHNIFLNIWTELGLLGLLSFAFISYLVFRYSTTPRLYDSMTFFLPLLQMTLHGLLDVPYFKNDLSVLTWIFLALLYTEYAKHHSPTETRS